MRDGLLAGMVFLASAALCALLVPMSRALARRLGVMDHPGGRKVHSAPIPRLGGLAVFASFLVVVAVGYLAAPALHESPLLQARLGGALAILQDASRVERKLIGLMAGSGLAFGIGVLDDVLGPRLPVLVKAGGQLLAAAVVVAAGIRTSFLPSDWMNVVVTLFWLVGMTNAFNLLDNMDGLCAGVALVASGVFLLNAWMLGEFLVGLLLVAFMGSLLGFLLFNFHRATVFLGDGGSHFVGFVMGSLTLLERYLSHASSSLFPVLMPVLVLAIPLIDTSTVVFVRVYERRPIYVGDARHLSHRLVSMGLSPRAAVLFIYLATFCIGLGAVSLANASVGQSILILLQCASFVALLLILLFIERRRRPRGASS